jgi:molybdopterin synthase sulfur carrier subunit
VRVEVQLFATLAAYLPRDNRDGRAALEIPDGSTLADICAILRLPADLSCVYLVNGQEAAPDRRLDRDDLVSIFPPLAGGVAR